MGADPVRGHGRLNGPRRVAVETPNDGRVLAFAQHGVAVCAGSRAALPDLPGIAEVRPRISRDVVDLDHGYMLGVTFVGPGVAELLHSATVAVAGQVPIDRLWHAVPCFPTISEVWPRLLEAYRG